MHFGFIASLLNLSANSVEIEHASIQELKKSIVSVQSTTVAAAYSPVGQYAGTAFFVHKDESMAILLTNKHVIVGDGVVDEYVITLSNDQKMIAKRMYVDPHHDFGFLIINHTDISSIPCPLEFSDTEIAEYDPVVIIGNNAGEGFSIQGGHVARMHCVSNPLLAGEEFRMSLNTKGGSSGSPIIKDGKVVGLNYAGSDTSAYALPIHYAKDALQNLLQGVKPARYGIGASFELTTLNDLEKYDNFPESIAESYRADSSKSQNILTIKAVLKDAPAEGILNVGDAILSVNDVEIGSSLYMFNKIINDSLGERVELRIVRNGEPLTISVDVYDLHIREIRKILQFGGATFYECDDLTRHLTGIHKGIICQKTEQSTIFSGFPVIMLGDGNFAKRICLKKINGHEVKTLEDLTRELNHAMQKKHFTMDCQNLLFAQVYDGRFTTSTTLMRLFATYSELFGKPVSYELDSSDRWHRIEWQS